MRMFSSRNPRPHVDGNSANEEQSHQMLFPRVLALAERAWHRAAWENATSEEDRD